MTQELIDLRNYIIEKKYTDALAIVDELEGMSKQAILRNIQSFLLRILIHLIKNQVENRLTNSWANAIRSSLREIKKLNLKDNKRSYYVNQDEWELMLLEEFEEAIREASEEVMNGICNPFKLAERKYPVDYAYPMEEIYSIAITFPEGYALEELPEGTYFVIVEIPERDNLKGYLELRR